MKVYDIYTQKTEIARPISFEYKSKENRLMKVQYVDNQIPMAQWEDRLATWDDVNKRWMAIGDLKHLPK